MAEISVEMVRRKAEHNDKEISTLEELSLHQENIEKIDHIQNWCRHLQILLLQSNLIRKIENLNKLKKLRYLNLALNNIEKIENLEGLESLEKLDLTLNFIGDIQSVARLSKNIHLQNLILTGNPCSTYQHYRDFVITKLPQITELDGKNIVYSERLLANQGFADKLQILDVEQRQYEEQRLKEKEEEENFEETRNDEDFWSRPGKNTPEERSRIAKMAQKNQNSDTTEKPKPAAPRLFNKDGKPLNTNQAKIPLRLYEQDRFKILDISLYKYLDSSYIAVDVQPLYARIKVKDKYIQVVFDDEDEVDVSGTTCCRSMTTGHLEIKMPLLRKKNFVIKPKLVKSSHQRPILEPQQLENKEQHWEDNPEVPPLI